MAVATVAVTGSDRLASEQETEERQADFREQQARLQEARQLARITQEDAASSEEELGVENTGRAERVSIFSYSAPLIVACFKDLLDFSIVLALPGIGTVISFCLNTLIFLLLIFPKRRYRLMTNMRLAIIDAFILLGLLPLEGIAFPFNVIPFTVAAVGMIYLFDKKFVAARNAKRFDRKKMKAELTNIIRKAGSAKGMLEA